LFNINLKNKIEPLLEGLAYTKKNNWKWLEPITPYFRSKDDG
jgi:hypothetical protein